MTFTVCLELPELPDPQTVTLPGGIAIESINLMQVIQPALAPLVPMFNIVDTVVSIFNCVKAISTLQIDAIMECIPDLAEKIGKLLKLIPQLSLPLMLVDLLDLVIHVLNQARNELMHLQQQMVQILGVVDRATDLDDAGLMAIAQCAQANVAQEAANVGKSLASIGKLLGLINLFMGMIGGPEVPDLSDLAGRPLDEVVEPLDGLVRTLKAARNAVPIP